MADASQDEVLAWMTQTGSGYYKAAKHFGISPSTVKSWQRRSQIAVGASGSAQRTQSAPNIQKEDCTQSAPNPPPAPLSPKEREAQILRAIDVRVNELANPASVGKKGERDCSIALGILMEKLKLHREVYGLGDGSEDTGRAEPSGVLAAMGLSEGPPS